MFTEQGVEMCKHEGQTRLQLKKIFYFLSLCLAVCCAIRIYDELKFNITKAVDYYLEEK